MSVVDEVLCNQPFFGEHRGKIYPTVSLDAIFPGAQYEITPSGRLELLVCIYENRSGPKATGMAALFGAVTPAFTGERQDVDFHGWLHLGGFGRAKFTDGILVAVDPYPPNQGMY